MHTDDFIAKEDDEVSIPRAALNKFVKDIVPDARLTNETREVLLNCCHKFIHTLATNSSLACAQANKKTINPEHVLRGLDLMGMSDYKEEARSASEEAKVELKDRRMLRASYKFKQHDSKELEELIREQQAIFEQARASFLDDQSARNELTLAEESNVNAINGTINHSTQQSSDEQAIIFDDGVFKRPAIPRLHTLTGSARLLASSCRSSSANDSSSISMPNDNDEDYYD